MTIAATTNRVTYTGNGATTAFAFAYPFHAQADLVVIETIIATGVQTTKALTTDYTISGTTDAQGHYSSGGTVNAVTAPASTVTWTIYRDPSPIQSTDFVQNDDLPAESLESALDYQTLLNQRTRDMIARALRQPEGDSATIDVLPAKVTRASKFLAFDANGDPIAAAGTAASLTPVSAFIDTLLDDASATTARATLGAAASGAVTASDLTMATARLLGRTTASTGAVEEISVGASLTLSGGSLSGTASSETQAGVIELATQAEVSAMTDTSRAVTPNHNKIILGTYTAATSGTSIDFTGIPSGVRRIIMLLDGVSLNNTAQLRVQVGDAGGVETSGYTGWMTTVTVTETQTVAGSGADFSSQGASSIIRGRIVIELMDSATNTWLITVAASLGTADAVVGSVVKATSATLDRVRLTTVAGTATFDSGAINIHYER